MLEWIIIKMVVRSSRKLSKRTRYTISPYCKLQLTNSMMTSMQWFSSWSRIKRSKELDIHPIHNIVRSDGREFIVGELVIGRIDDSSLVEIRHEIT